MRFIHLDIPEINLRCRALSWVYSQECLKAEGKSIFPKERTEAEDLNPRKHLPSQEATLSFEPSPKT